jgi:cysteine desulfurase
MSDESDELYYLDYQATTPLDPRVLAVMQPTFLATFGNAASVQHEAGRAAHDLVEAARLRIATAIGARPQEIYFTSGATESNNIAVLGGLAPLGHSSAFATSPTEHKSVLDCAVELTVRGRRVSFIQVDRFGMVDVDSVKAALSQGVRLLSVMAANNEIGTLAPVEEIGRICRDNGVLFHCDATQAFGRVPVDVREWNVDLMSLSAHKVYGPKGVGVLYVRRGVEVRPIMFGGGHERGLRSGTLNVGGCVGFGAAASLVVDELEKDRDHTSGLRKRLLDALTDIPEISVNGHPVHHLPNNLNICFAGSDADDVMLLMPKVAASSGSACTSASPAPSHVLRAIGLSYEDARASVRFGIGRFTTAEEIDAAAAMIRSAVSRSRAENRQVTLGSAAR